MTQRGRPRNRAKNTIICQLEDTIREHFALALKKNERRPLRNGNGLPLSAWMAGAPKTAESKIVAVTNGQARHPYLLPGDAARILARAIAHRYDVTNVQLDLIENYVLRNYRGRERQTTPIDMGLTSQPPDADMGKTYLSRKALDDSCRAIGRSHTELPLRALIDPKVTNALLLLQLKETIERKTYKVCKI